MPVAVNAGTRIYYEVTGAGPVVVLMHGIGDTGEIWRQLGAVDRLAAHFTVVTIDLRGLGRSDMPSEPAAYTRDVRRDDTIAVLDAIEAQRAHLVGYSLGGRNAFYVASHQPDRIASVVAGGANPFPSRPNFELAGHLARMAERPPKVVRAYLRLRRKLIGPSRPEQVERLINAASAMSGEFDVDAAAEAMKMPVYLFTGEFDQRFAVELTKDFASRLDDCRLEIVPGENHGMLPRMQPMLPKIEQFLLGVGAPAS